MSVLLSKQCYIVMVENSIHTVINRCPLAGGEPDYLALEILSECSLHVT